MKEKFPETAAAEQKEKFTDEILNEREDESSFEGDHAMLIEKYKKVMLWEAWSYCHCLTDHSQIVQLYKVNVG